MLDVQAYVSAVRAQLAQLAAIPADVAADVTLDPPEIFDPEESEALADLARVTCPDRARWEAYPAPMRAVWRERFGVRWRAQLALPVAPVPGDPPQLPDGQEPTDGQGPATPDTRPADPPPAPRIPPRGFLAQLAQLDGAAP